jgi:C-terminal processing protease CtpA/Prc
VARTSTARRALLTGLLLIHASACGGPAIGSVGAILSRHNETHALTVREAPPGLAAEKAGLEPADEILMIDGHYVRDLTMNEVTSLLRGEVGSWVELTIVRGGRGDGAPEPGSPAEGAVQRIRVQRTAITTAEKPKPSATPRAEPPEPEVLKE